LDYKYNESHNDDIAQLLSSITPTPHKGRTALSAFGKKKKKNFFFSPLPFTYTKDGQNNRRGYTNGEARGKERERKSL